MKPRFLIFAACIMFMAVPMSAKAQTMFGAYLHAWEASASTTETGAWAAEAEAWAATVRGNIDADNNSHHSAWLKMISRTQELVAMQQERASVPWDFSDTLFARKRASALREDASKARENASFGHQMALEAQENMMRLQAEATGLGWREGRGEREYEAEVQSDAYEAWSRAVASWEWAARNLEAAAESWDEALSIELADLFGVLQEHLTPEGVIVLFGAVGEDWFPLVPEVGAFDFSGDINEHVKFGQFMAMEDLWATDIELDEFLLEVPPGCRVNTNAPSGGEGQQDFVACLINISHYCFSGAYIFGINDEFRAWSSNIACATGD